MASESEQGRESEARVAPPRARTMRRAGLAVAGLIVVLGAVAFWVAGRTAPWRDPLEFLPSSTRAAVVVDMRLESPGMRQAVKHWSASDLKELGSRGVQIGQKAVSWLGLDLEVKQDVLTWFGGKLVAAVVDADEGTPPGPDSLVLIAATRNPRRTRASMEKGTRPYTKDGYWRAVTEHVADETVTVWRDDRGANQLAYVVKDSCLLLAKGPDAIEACLRAGQRPADRFTATPAYEDSAGKLSREAIGWAYADVGTAVQYARFGRAWLQGGTCGVVREYLAGTGPGQQGALAGNLAVGLVAAKQGAELRLVYDRAKAAAPAQPAGSLGDIAQFVPREAVAYVAVHRPAELLQRLPYYDWPGKGKRSISPASAYFPTVDVSTALGFREPPTDVLVGVLPRMQPGDKGQHHAFVLVAPAKQVVLPPRGSLVGLLKTAGTFREFAVSKGYAILGSDKEAVAQCRQAAAQGEAPFETKAAVQFVLYTRPREVFRTLAWLQGVQVQEVRVVGRSTAAGGEGEISVVVPPRYLLGGD